MTDHTEAIIDLLHEASETHHRVYRIVDGADPDWACSLSEPDRHPGRDRVTQEA